jgi:hypothetical protein
MRLHRIRAAAILATLTVGLAAGSADARPNDGRYAKSGEAMKAKQSYDCDFTKTAYDTYLQDAARLQSKGYMNAAVKEAQKAKDQRLDAKSNGCGWAKA